MTISNISFKVFLIFMFLSFACLIKGQCPNEVNHNIGSKMISSTKVRVSSEGAFNYRTEPDSNCEQYNLYYMIGRDSLSNDFDGSYTFNFSPPSEGVSLSFFRLTDVVSQGASEEIMIFVNGQHYPIPEIGKRLECDSDDNLAILTSEGNVRASPITTRGAWDGTYIEGNIENLTVYNKVFLAQSGPLKGSGGNGAFFTLFFCEGAVSAMYKNQEKGFLIYPNPGSEYIQIDFQDNSNSFNVELFDITGKKLKTYFNVKSGLKVHRDGLPVGLYNIRILLKDQLVFAKKILFLN